MCERLRRSVYSVGPRFDICERINPSSGESGESGCSPGTGFDARGPGDRYTELSGDCLQPQIGLGAASDGDQLFDCCISRCSMHELFDLVCQAFQNGVDGLCVSWLAAMC